MKAISARLEAAMTAQENKGREARNELTRALAGWDDEGGAFQPEAEGQATLGEAEERILKCLGAAVIVQWNDLPTEVQRHLFRQAVAMAEPRNASQLKAEIARFLHNHKDDEAVRHLPR
jgi:hypothetical protein